MIRPPGSGCAPRPRLLRPTACPYALPVAELKNKFTWSASRHGSFSYCHRQYWWSYYGSWGGWNRDAPPRAREAYMLKNLANRWTWAGTVVHEAIEDVLRGLHGGGEQRALGFEQHGLDIEEEVEKATKLMREQWVESRNAHYRIRPKKRFGLAEHEYDEVIPRAEWKATNEKVQNALRAFFNSPLWDRIRETDPHDWLPIETLDQFDFEGTGIWAVLDFALRVPGGGIEIFDWKTGEVKPDANKLQLGCYALYVGQKHDVPPESVTTHLVYLGEDLQEFTFRMTEKDLVETRGEMRASIAAMRTRLRDPEANVAVREDFEMTDDLSKCRICAYRRLCGRE